ncbi:Carbonic anhydrase [Zancudomyces culisetae]|uniref:Carbonic anhydrase n=1 Tax=Zancudomyces culisetae TaxID=1213189 RepID=A0A1R1PGJ9_ZANCU|nr:Carbonic anhydrase [Zancudomyces culisetae]|eukprot:OMH80101.1 Carbonic anhydrase [Zancudomyces culisetae]
MLYSKFISAGLLSVVASATVVPRGLFAKDSLVRRDIVDTIISEDEHWAEANIANYGPEFFTSHLAGQNPDLLYIGCSDSRVPSDVFMNATLGEVFTHRNIANSIVLGDPNTMSVIDYALVHLNVSTIAITGHTGCGGVKASMDPEELEKSIKTFIKPITRLYQKNKSYIDALPTDAERQSFLVQLNVMRLVRLASNLKTVTERWEKGLPLVIHGLVYRMENGTLHDLNVTVSSKGQFDELYYPPLKAQGLEFCACS